MIEATAKFSKIQPFAHRKIEIVKRSEALPDFVHLLRRNS